METKLGTVIAQQNMNALCTQVQNMVDMLKHDGWELHQTDTVYNGHSYSSLLTFKKNEK